MAFYIEISIIAIKPFGINHIRIRFHNEHFRLIKQKSNSHRTQRSSAEVLLLSKRYFKGRTAKGFTTTTAIFALLQARFVEIIINIYALAFSSPIVSTMEYFSRF